VTDRLSGDPWTLRVAVAMDWRRRPTDSPSSSREPMNYDIFLSHSSDDRPLVEKAKAELVALGYGVFVDSDALPKIAPDKVTRKTAETLRDAMQKCTALLYLISANSGTSRWMPWELGYFDGFSGRVFIYPLDQEAADYAKGREYLKIYPIVPLKGRAEYLRKYVPRSAAPGRQPVVAQAPRTEQLGGLEDLPRPPLFDYAQQQRSMLDGVRLKDQFSRALVNPVRAFEVTMEMVQAYWRVLGLMPPPRRPGEDEGKWNR
jgi:hypothetical protein